MISKSSVSLIRSLDNKKFREKTGLFLVEGDKICDELLKSDYHIKEIYFLNKWKKNNLNRLSSLHGEIQMFEVSETELMKISHLSTPNQVLALVYMQKHNLEGQHLNDGPVILLDNIQDPGNLGTIIRTADWFGFKNIVASLNTVDLYNQKVIQSSMGSIFRVNYRIENLEQLLFKNERSEKWPVYATVLNGQSVYHKKLVKNSYFLFGNEGSGVSSTLQTISNEHITIPKASIIAGNPGAESLNVGIAAAIIMAEYARQKSG